MIMFDLDVVFWRHGFPFGALLLATTVLAAHPLMAQEPVSGEAASLYEKGLIPIGIGLVDEFPHQGADAVLIRRTESSPHDVILLKADAATPDLLVQAIFTLYAAHRVGYVCPRQDRTIRVTARSGAPPPMWSDGDLERLGKVLPLLEREPKQVREFGVVRWREIWIRRFYNERDPLPVGGPARSVC